MSKLDTAIEEKPVAKPVGVSLYPSEIEAVERIRVHFDLDNFSQTVRRMIRLQVREIPDAPTSESAA